MSFRILALLCLSLFSCIANHEKDFKKYFDEYEVEGSFVLYDETKDEFIHYNPQSCKQAFSPASTFKIPNSLIALEENILQDENVYFFATNIESPKALNNFGEARKAITLNILKELGII